ncbi:hypothetical protein TSMEX_003953 [Taenia solium]|eukprot:TsM_000371600 transcript=TsM_000371600 gene=TsM_000371600
MAGLRAVPTAPEPSVPLSSKAMNDINRETARSGIASCAHRVTMLLPFYDRLPPEAQVLLPLGMRRPHKMRQGDYGDKDPNELMLSIHCKATSCKELTESAARGTRH